MNACACACDSKTLDACLPTPDADQIAEWNRTNVVIVFVLLFLVVVGVGLVGAHTGTEIGIALMVVGSGFLILFFAVQSWRTTEGKRKQVVAVRMIITGFTIVLMCFAQLENTDSVISAVVIGFVVVFTGTMLLDAFADPTRKLVLLVVAQLLYVVGGAMFPVATTTTSKWGVGFIVAGVLCTVSFLWGVWVLHGESTRSMVLLTTFTLGTTFVTSVVVLRTASIQAWVIIPIVGIVLMLLSVRFMEPSATYSRLNLCPCLPCLSS